MSMNKVDILIGNILEECEKQKFTMREAYGLQEALSAQIKQRIDAQMKKVAFENKVKQ
ncbi:MAG: hypothetical protein GXZ14_00990 [Ruminococcaceae bacterium]|nr:hypothetical protein [Oscillospiraceae bacterium]